VKNKNKNLVLFLFDLDSRTISLAQIEKQTDHVLSLDRWMGLEAWLELITDNVSQVNKNKQHFKVNMYCTSAASLKEKKEKNNKLFGWNLI